MRAQRTTRQNELIELTPTRLKRWRPRKFCASAPLSCKRWRFDAWWRVPLCEEEKKIRAALRTSGRSPSTSPTDPQRRPKAGPSRVPPNHISFRSAACANSGEAGRCPESGRARRKSAESGPHLAQNTGADAKLGPSVAPEASGRLRPLPSLARSWRAVGHLELERIRPQSAKADPALITSGQNSAEFGRHSSESGPLSTGFGRTSPKLVRSGRE